MAKGFCSAEAQEQCALAKHFSDQHHLYYPGRDYKSKAEKAFRERPENKIQICRGIHDAIHASGYIPEKPSKQEMANQAWAKGELAEEELNRQLFLARLTIERDGELPDDPEDIA